MLREWDENREVDWHLTDDATHADFLTYISELNRLYRESPALWSLDHSYEGFKWVDNISDNPCVFGYTRTDGVNTVLVALNFSDVPAILPQMDNLTPIFATDSISSPATLPPFGGMVFARTKE